MMEFWLLSTVIMLSWLTSDAQQGYSLMDDNKLIYSDGVWHKQQRHLMPYENCDFETHGCTSEMEKEFEATPELSQHEVNILVELYVLLDGDNWRKKTNWVINSKAISDPETGEFIEWEYTTPSISACYDMWYGITCNQQGQITELNLKDNRLRGNFETREDGTAVDNLLDQLLYLRKIDLGTSQVMLQDFENPNRNRITGPFPHLFHLEHLISLDLTGNEIEDLDWIHLNGDTLQTLSAPYNKLKKVPDKINLFVALQTIDLSHNEIEFIPAEFGQNMVEMRYVNLSNNKINGELRLDIENNLGHMIKNRIFDISRNRDLSVDAAWAITGEFPKQLVVDEPGAPSYWPENEYVSIVNTRMRGYVAELCLDVPFCYRPMYNTHPPLVWGTSLPNNTMPVIERAMKLYQASISTSSTTAGPTDVFAVLATLNREL